MKKMIAIVKDKQNKEIHKIESEYESKSNFRKDLNRNGYQVIGRIEIEDEENERKRLYDKGIRI